MNIKEKNSLKLYTVFATPFLFISTITYTAYTDNIRPSLEDDEHAIVQEYGDIMYEEKNSEIIFSLNGFDSEKNASFKATLYVHLAEAISSPTYFSAFELKEDEQIIYFTNRFIPEGLSIFNQYSTALSEKGVNALNTLMRTAFMMIPDLNKAYNSHIDF